MSIRYTRSVVGAAVFTCAFAGWGASKALAQTDDHGAVLPVAAPSLPKTASPFPAIGLLGLWSLGTAMGLRLFDRMRPGPS